VKRKHPTGAQWPLCVGGFACEWYYLTIKHRCVYQCQVDRVEFAVDVLSAVAAEDYRVHLNKQTVQLSSPQQRLSVTP
jgi:hypothetical protein